jgi:hypothetical protein
MRPLAVIGVVTLGPFAVADGGDAFFESRIRPALVEHCYPCHSAAAGKTKGGLRLDTRAGTRAGGESGPAVVPNRPADSLLIQALQHTGERKMPPAGKLADAVIADFTQWVQAGAADPRGSASGGVAARDWWAFKPLQRPAGPASPTAIDALLLRRLAQDGRTFAPPADPRTLIRRLYLDVTGIPPTPDEVAAFLADGRPNAYESLVDRVLASPRYGERWARHWLDVARFAESSGYEHDNDRPHAYHYRDFVIEALNRDLPYDRFMQWQIAGDLIAPDEPLALKATGFLAAGPMNGQVTEREAENERYEVLDDWVGTTGTAFLGLTIGCARCHDHKFDPISAEDYYRFTAHFTTAVRTHFNVPPDASGVKRKQDNERRLVELTAQRARFESLTAPRRAEAWRVASPEPPEPWAVLTDVTPAVVPGQQSPTGEFTLTPRPDGSFVFSRVNGEIGAVELSVRTELDAIAFVRIEALTDRALPNFGPGLGDHGNFSVSVACTNQATKPVKLELIESTAAEKPGGGTWSVPATAAGRAQAAVFKLTPPLHGPTSDFNLRLTFPGDSPAGRQTLGCFRVSVGSAGTTPQVWGPALPHSELVQARRDLEAGQTSPAVVRLFCTQDAEWLRLDAAVRDAARDAGGPASHVVFGVGEEVIPYRMMVQGPDLFRTSYLLKRGDPARKEREVTPATLSALGKPVAPKRQPRAELARWLTDVENGAGALAARVAVNRLWQHHFGGGIVGTPSDFGAQGDKPTHRELLEWLATELVVRKWSLKAIHKQILMTTAYRQSGGADDGLLGHFPPRRLEAEAIRDSMLAVSGRLDERMFGPGTLDEAMNRRSIYFTVKRSKLIPAMVQLDWPEALVGVGRRPGTTVPPQALWALNDPQVRACAAALAERVKELPDDLAIAAMYELCVSRPPSAAERLAALAFVRPHGESGRETKRADFAHALLMSNEFFYLR